MTPPNGIDDFKLAVDGRSYFLGNINSDLIDVVNTHQNVDAGYDLIFGNYKYYQANDVGLMTLSSQVQPSVWQTVFTARNNGKVAIGTTQYNCSSCTGYRLFVKDGIKTEKVKVEIAAENGWADYVFAKDYKLMPLQELESYISNNGHLREVPSTEEAIQNGIELKEMNILLLKKVEELTLHLIEQNKRIEKLENKKTRYMKTILSGLAFLCFVFLSAQESSKFYIEIPNNTFLPSVSQKKGNRWHFELLNSPGYIRMKNS